ncbi:MAG: hypothetical protein ABII23_02480 [bacterium]
MAKKKKVKKPAKKRKLKKRNKRKKVNKVKRNVKKRLAKKKKAKNKKSSVRKPKPKPKPKQQPADILPWRKALPGEILLGVVEDYFSHVNVLATTLQTAVQVGNKIHVRGHTTDLMSPVTSMQIEHQPVESAGSGDSIGIKIGQKVRKGDYIYKIY